MRSTRCPGGEVSPAPPGRAGAEGEVVLAGAALVGMALDQERVARVARQPLRLLVEGGGGGALKSVESDSKKTRRRY